MSIFLSQDEDDETSQSAKQLAKDEVLKKAGDLLVAIKE